MDFWVFVLLIVLISSGGGIINNMMSHRQKLAELRMKGLAEADAATVTELRELKKELAELRDTSTRYDMSFDTALQRMEARLGGLEQRVRTVEGSAAATHASGGRD